MYLATTALHRIRGLTRRVRVVQGGSSAGKTIAILLVLIDQAQREKGLTISVVSETLPHLKRGAIRDFLSIMETQGYYDDKRWNRSDFIYTFETGSRIEFFSADDPKKVRGPRRNILFINEANALTFETYTQLAIRTSGTIYIDFNPVAEFWAHTDLPKEDLDFIILTYKDNEALAPSIVQEIESRRGNKFFWTVYGLGQTGEVEGKIYRDWPVIDAVPHEARLERYGLDFGYTNDPTAIVAVYRYNGGYILDEVAYTKGLSNKQIADLLVNVDRALVVADSAEPKSIDEIASYGVNIVAARKGPDSIVNGIQLVQQQRISMTSRSVNLIKEYRNYLWLVDKEGRPVNEPSPIWNHAMDALRYAFQSLLDHLPEAVRFKQEQHFQQVESRQAMHSTK
jgi:phage terminase large subunit